MGKKQEESFLISFAVASEIERQRRPRSKLQRVRRVNKDKIEVKRVINFVKIQ